jgi:hypothetical protein
MIGRTRQREPLVLLPLSSTSVSPCCSNHRSLCILLPAEKEALRSRNIPPFHQERACGEKPLWFSPPPSLSLDVSHDILG